MAECVTHHHACDCREALTRELARAAGELAGAYWRMEQYGFIGTHGDSAEEDAMCAHWKHIAHEAMETIRRLGRVGQTH